jgi:hypothetical protein
MDPQDLIAVALGQKYKDLPFGERYGDWPADERQQGIQRLMEEYDRERQGPAGFDTVDPLGHRGVRHPSGYYLLKGI